MNIPDQELRQSSMRFEQNTLSPLVRVSGSSREDVAEAIHRMNCHHPLVAALQRFMDLGTMDDQGAIDAAREALSRATRRST